MTNPTDLDQQIVFFLNLGSVMDIDTIKETEYTYEVTLENGTVEIVAKRNLALHSSKVTILEMTEVKKAAPDTYSITYVDYKGQVETVVAYLGEMFDFYTGDTVNKGIFS